MWCDRCCSLCLRPSPTARPLHNMLNVLSLLPPPPPSRSVDLQRRQQRHEPQTVGGSRRGASGGVRRFQLVTAARLHPGRRVAAGESTFNTAWRNCKSLSTILKKKDRWSRLSLSVFCVSTTDDNNYPHYSQKCNGSCVLYLV